MRRALLAVLVASTLGAAAPQGDVSISRMAARVDSLAARIDSLEQQIQYIAETEAREWRRDRWRRYAIADSTRARCHAITKAGHQCRRKAAAADSLCTQHRRVTK